MLLLKRIDREQVVQKPAATVGGSTLGPYSLEHYDPIIGATAVVRRSGEEIDLVQSMRVVHVSSTFYGVIENLHAVDAEGIETDSHLNQGT